MFAQVDMKLYRIKEIFHLSDLQFERIKSTIFKAGVWDDELDKSIVDFMNEFDEEEKAEMRFRYETAKLAGTSAQELWNQLNICAGIELAKQDMIVILHGFIEYFEVFADSFNDGNDTEIITNLRKSLKEINRM